MVGADVPLAPIPTFPLAPGFCLSGCCAACLACCACCLFCCLSWFAKLAGALAASLCLCFESYSCVSRICKPVAKLRQLSSALHSAEFSPVSIFGHPMLYTHRTTHRRPFNLDEMLLDCLQNMWHKDCMPRRAQGTGTQVAPSPLLFIHYTHRQTD
jgi:hypothetical protein